MSLFGISNPFGTPVGQRIETATHESQASEDWALIMEICDIINETDEGPKDAMKALKKRLSTHVKNYTVIMYSLTVMETCVKNCGKRFYIHVANKDFLHDLIKIIGPKNEPPQIVQEKILSLIQTWSDAFRGVPELKEVEKVYIDLKSKGIEFPMTDLDSLAPIHTPARSAPEADSVRPTSAVRPPSSRQNQYVFDDFMIAPVVAPTPAPGVAAPTQQLVYATGPVTPTMEQLAKLRSELDTVQANVRVLSEMLTEVNPGQDNQEDWQLLQELHRTCKQMQQRIVELVERIQNEEVTEELLRVNDDLNTVFLRYERCERATSGTTNTLPANEMATIAVTDSTLNAPPPSYTAAASEPIGSDGVLIDLNSPPPNITPTPAQTNPFSATNGLEGQLAAMNVSNTSVSSQLGQLNTTPAATGQQSSTDDFDMFAQSRQSFDTRSNMTASESYANQRDDGGHIQGGLVSAVNYKADPSRPQTQANDKVQEYGEMEDWLKSNPTAQNTATSSGPTGEPATSSGPTGEPATSSEFDTFLAGRAAAEDNLPPINSQGQRSANQTSRNGRQLQSDDDNALFAL